MRWAELGGSLSVSDTGEVRGRKVFADKDGYLKVSFNNKKVFVHRLILSTFRPTDDQLEVDHINGNRQDNRLSNLQWVSHVDNIRLAVSRGSFSDNHLKKGSNHGRAVLDEIQVLTIRTMPNKGKNGRLPGWSDKELAEVYGVSKTRIHNIRKYKEWTHI